MLKEENSFLEQQAKGPIRRIASWEQQIGDPRAKVMHRAVDLERPKVPAFCHGVAEVHEEGVEKIARPSQSRSSGLDPPATSAAAFGARAASATFRAGKFKGLKEDFKE